MQIIRILLLLFPTLCFAKDFFEFKADYFDEEAASEIAQKSNTQLIYRFYFNQDYNYLGSSMPAMIRIEINYPNKVGDISQLQRIGRMDGMTGSLKIKTNETESISVLYDENNVDELLRLVVEIGTTEIFALSEGKSFENINEVMDGHPIWAERIRGHQITQISRKAEESYPAERLQEILNRTLTKVLIENSRNKNKQINPTDTPLDSAPR